MIGTFLPWLRSGTVERTSYAGGAALRRLVQVGDLLSLALHVWPFVGILAAAAVALGLLGLRRVGGVLALAVAAYAGGVAGWALSVHATGLVRAAHSGPIVTLVGATITVGSLILGVLSGRSGRAPQ
ncbi:MAG: hypothetical protein ACTHMS_21630 [Jatrophihabitans sp.]|uniref:hypothetical protein n=1 Tax=Jatrophihabitans sp. TaxID=1932789 RepID=UPI003F800DBF